MRTKTAFRGDVKDHSERLVELRERLLDDEELDEFIHVEHHKQMDPQRDEVYELEETYKEIALHGKSVAFAYENLHYGLRIRIDTEYEIADVLPRIKTILHEFGYDKEDYEVETRSALRAEQISITFEWLIDCAEAQVEKDDGWTQYDR